jgi:hypothetical protein
MKRKAWARTSEKSLLQLVNFTIPTKHKSIADLILMLVTISNVRGHAGDFGSAGLTRRGGLILECRRVRGNEKTGNREVRSQLSQSEPFT